MPKYVYFETPLVFYKWVLLYAMDITHHFSYDIDF